MSEPMPSSSKNHIEIRDAVGVVIGDNNVIYQNFLERGAPLADKLITFSTLIEERTRRFVGRRFVLERIDQFLSEQDRGYLVIVGEPGIGKTSLMSFLVSTRGWPHHFVISARGITQQEQFLENISAQLIARFGLNRKHIPPEAGRDGAFLAALLDEASVMLSPGERVVILVDALDEADPPRHGRGNILCLPENLPKGVYFIVTQRPVPVALACPDAPPKTFVIEAAQIENQRDAQAYIVAATERDEIRAPLRAVGISPEHFAAALLTKSQGNFMYLHHVIQGIAKGSLSPVNLDDLPNGLLNYYEQVWRGLQSRESGTWLAAYLPILGLLATAKTPLSMDVLCNILHMDLEGVALTVEKLREYLACDRGQYQLYHASFRNFVQQHLPDPKKYHRLIAHRYQDAAGIIPPQALSKVEREYAFRYLADHLVEAGEPNLLYQFVEAEAWSAEYPTHDFAHTIDLALQVAGSPTKPALAQIVSYSLTRSTIMAQANNIPPAALKAMMLLGEPGRALGLASLIIDPAHRFEAYWELAQSYSEVRAEAETLRIRNYSAGLTRPTY